MARPRCVSIVSGFWGGTGPTIGSGFDARGTGHVNHSIFWKNLCPPKVHPAIYTSSRNIFIFCLHTFPASRLCCELAAAARLLSRFVPKALVACAPEQDYAPPSGELAKLIEKDFGGLDKLTAKFSAAAVGVQGSGWGVRAAEAPAPGLAARLCAVVPSQLPGKPRAARLQPPSARPAPSARRAVAAV